MRLNPDLNPKQTTVSKNNYMGLVNQVIACVPDEASHYKDRMMYVNGTVVVMSYMNGTTSTSHDGKWLHLEGQQRYCDMSKISVDSEKHLKWYFYLE